MTRKCFFFTITVQDEGVVGSAESLVGKVLFVVNSFVLFGETDREPSITEN